MSRSKIKYKGEKMQKKYILTKNKKRFLGRILFQIKALIDFKYIKKGELGGYIEKESNLSQDGDAWVSGNAQVYDDAWVSGNAQVYGDALVSGNARVSGDALVSGNAQVYGDALVSGNAQVYDDAWVSGNARVSGDALVSGNARVYGKIKINIGYYFGMQYNKEKIMKLKTEDGNYILWKR